MNELYAGGVVMAIAVIVIAFIYWKGYRAAQIKARNDALTTAYRVAKHMEQVRLEAEKSRLKAHEEVGLEIEKIAKEIETRTYTAFE